MILVRKEKVKKIKTDNIDGITGKGKSLICFVAPRVYNLDFFACVDQDIL